MKGIILSGGTGSRLFPLTRVTSKQLLPIYNKPMIYYPLEKLINAGITEIAIIVAPEHGGRFLNLLQTGEHLGIKITWLVQEKPEGLAQAYLLAESFIGDDDVTMILGDNIFESEIIDEVKNFKGGGIIFARQVSNPSEYGVVQFDDNKKAIRIEEKPKEWISDYMIPGIYIFDHRCVEAAKQAKRSQRGELEITEIHNWYLDRDELAVKILDGEWFDAGTFDTYVQTNDFALRLAKEGREIGVKDPRDWKDLHKTA